MEKTTPFQFNPFFPPNPISKERKKANCKFYVLGVSQTSNETPPSCSSNFTGFSSYSSIFYDPNKLHSLDSVKQIHTQIVKTSNGSNLGSWPNKLISMYTKFGDIRSASMVFFIGFHQNSLSFSSLVEEFNGNSRELVEIFVELHRKGRITSGEILSVFVRISVDLMDLWLGMEIHAALIKLGFDSDVHLKCSLINFYANCVSFDCADQVFDEMPIRNTPLWKEMIMVYAERGMWLKVLSLFHEMQFSFTKADTFTITKALQACGRVKALEEGKQIHGYVIRSVLHSDLLINNSLISLYNKNSKLDPAKKVFKSMVNRSLVSWNSMISGYALNGFLDEAWNLFKEMGLSEMKPDLVTWNSLISGYSLHGSNKGVLKVLQRMQIAGFNPNSSTITSILQAITESNLLKLGKEIHGYVTRKGLNSDIYVGTSLVDMYVKNNCLTDAQKVFDNMNNRNIYAWNSLVSGYAYNGSFEKALELLNQMEKEGIEPDLVTWNGLISGYSMWGFGKKALLLIRQLKTLGLNTNVVSWTSLISGSSQNENFDDSLDFFIQMQQAGIDPNSATIASLLRACAGLASLNKGAELHCYAIRCGFNEDVFVATALVDMYCKSGSLKSAHCVFTKTRNKNLVSWNAMMMGFSVHGLGREAISLFDEMCELGIRPDGITFTALLSGCRHSGLINEGWKYFDSMRTDYSLIPSLEHYACMVDLLGRSGYLDEAWDFIQAMPLDPDASVWGALLGACRIHKNLELAEIAVKHLFKLEPYNSGNYLLMMNLYAIENRWEDVEDLRDLMNAVGVKNRPGWSWIQVDQMVHVFSVEGKPHPDIGEIYFELYQMVSDMRELGYVPDTNCVVQNFTEEEKEKILLSHTEKLAITYGLLNTEMGMPIRVIKNTRVCNDCHIAAKYMSKVRGREIFLRDGIRFHHFVDGECSCNDYW